MGINNDERVIILLNDILNSMKIVQNQKELEISLAEERIRTEEKFKSTDSKIDRALEHAQKAAITGSTVVIEMEDIKHDIATLMEEYKCKRKSFSAITNTIIGCLVVGVLVGAWRLLEPRIVNQDTSSQSNLHVK